MGKKCLCLLLILLMVVLLGGCWDYRGLDEFSIVAGMSIDKDPQTGLYQLAFEVIDQTVNAKDEGATPMILDTEGETLFEATRSVKRRFINKLYFGHMQTLVLSEDLLKNQDVGRLLDWFLRSTEFRETLTVVVAKQQTARDAISVQGLGSKVNSLEIQKSAEEDNLHTASTSYVQLYNIYNTLEAKGKELTLPAVQNIDNAGNKTTELSGTAVFKGQRLIGYLTPEESKYFLFVMDQIKGGILTASSREEEENNVSLEITKNTTDLSFRPSGGTVKIEIETDTTVFLYEIGEPFDALEKEKITALEKAAAEKLARSIGQIIQKVQQEYGSDIFGFGNMIYKQNPSLWKKLEKEWDTLFPELEVKVSSTVRIVNSASVKKS